MAAKARRVVTGHDPQGKSVKLSDGIPKQDHAMQGSAVGADFIEIWNTPETVPTLASAPASEPTARPFTIMPATGHLMRVIEIYPPHMGGRRTVMHRTRTLDYAIVIEGEVVLILDDGEPARSSSSAAPITHGRTGPTRSPAWRSFTSPPSLARSFSTGCHSPSS